MKLVIPKSFKRLFWEFDISTFTINNSEFVIQRILEKGDIDSLRWVFDNFEPQEVTSVLKSKNISSSTRSFWQNLLNEEFFSAYKNH